MDDNGRKRREERQARLKERFLDLANVFVMVRMRFLRRTGVQPPDESAPPRRKKR